MRHKNIAVDLEKVQKLGMRLSDVNGTISTFLGGSFVNNFNAFGRQYRTYVQADAAYRNKPEDIGMFFVKDVQGNMVKPDPLADNRYYQVLYLQATLIFAGSNFEPLPMAIVLLMH